jgi:hypothetical protein
MCQASGDSLVRISSIVQLQANNRRNNGVGLELVQSRVLLSLMEK